MSKINFYIGTLSLSGKEKVCINLANNLSLQNDVTIYVKKGNIPYDLISKNVKVILIGNYFSFVNKLKKQTVFVFAYPLAYKLLFFSLLFNLSIKIFIRHATALKSIEIPPKHFSFLKKVAFFFYYNLALYFLFLFKNHIVLNEEMKSNLTNRFLFFRKNITIIRNPFPKDFIKYSPFTNRSYSVTYVGRFLEEKGFFDLLYVAKFYLPKIDFHFFGSFPYNDKRIKSSKLLLENKNVFIHHFTNDVCNIYQSSKLVVLPSYREGSPNVIIESLSIGVPVVSYNCVSGPKDLIIDGLNGFLVNLGNKKELADKILLSLNRNWDVKLIKNSIEKHSIEKIKPTIEELFK